MEQLTDGEIIKELERNIAHGCSPIGDEWGVFIRKSTLKNAIDIIKSQKVAIDKCEKALYFADKVIDLLMKDVKTAKHKAYKEFAEKLLEICSKDLTISNDSYSLIEENIKIIQKEMVGEK